MKYLLSTGRSTDKIEEYIMDIIKLNISILPGDIPRSNIGFNFILTDVKESELIDELRNRLSNLLDSIKRMFNNIIDISIDSVNFIEYGKVIVTITVNDYSDTLKIDLLDENNTRLYK